jgi:hypothetical protein
MSGARVDTSAFKLRSTAFLTCTSPGQLGLGHQALSFLELRVHLSSTCAAPPPPGGRAPRRTSGAWTLQESPPAPGGSPQSSPSRCRRYKLHFESKGLKPVFHFSVSRAETRRSLCGFKGWVTRRFQAVGQLDLTCTAPHLGVDLALDRLQVFWHLPVIRLGRHQHRLRDVERYKTHLKAKA